MIRSDGQADIRIGEQSVDKRVDARLRTAATSLPRDHPNVPGRSGRNQWHYGHPHEGLIQGDLGDEGDIYADADERPAKKQSAALQEIRS